VGDSLTRYIVVSLVLHGIVSGGVAGFASIRPKVKAPPIYKARIVSLAGPRGAAAATVAPPVVAPPKPAPAPPKEAPKPKPKAKEQVKTAKETKATRPVPSKTAPPKGKPQETVDAPADRRTGGFKGKKVEEPAAPATQLPGGGSATIGVDATDFTFSYYLVTVQNNIAKEWDPPVGIVGEGTVFAVIYFQIERDGRIVRPEVETSSGVSLFDETARRAVQRAVLPPLPSEFGDERLGIHFQFAYTP
jgi:TonB family protein